MAYRIARVALAAIALCIGCALPVLAQGDAPTSPQEPALGAVALSWLVPIGLGLVACGAVRAERVAAVIRVTWLALGVSAIVYWWWGFATQFGGVGFVVDHPDLAGLVRQWSWAPLEASWGAQWGVVGLTGYRLQGAASTPTALALFAAQLPWITTAVAIPLWSLQGRTRPVVLFGSAVLFASLYALLGNWTWGGGWLAHLGVNLGLGRGFVDLGGAGVVHLAAAASALAGMLAFGTRSTARAPAEQLSLPTLDLAPAGVRLAPDGETYVPMPPLHLPLLATLGAWLAVIGGMGWLASTPSHVLGMAQPAWVASGIALVLAAGGGAMSGAVLSWLLTGEGNALMIARSALGATIACSATAFSLPTWMALALGASVGALVPLVQYLVDHVLRLDDPTSALATHGVPALAGLLLLGIVDLPAQLRAQATGAAAVALCAFVLPWLLFAVVQGLTRAWRGEFQLRLPRHSRPRTALAGRGWPKRVRSWLAARRAAQPLPEGTAVPGPMVDADAADGTAGPHEPDAATPVERADEGASAGVVEPEGEAATMDPVTADEKG
ncbi:MAG: hypothetical protein JXA09_09750 [Anaerolineae bacterium]|nr:hypothetical protein [Anaerolineae bacterium]